MLDLFFSRPSTEAAGWLGWLAAALVRLNESAEEPALTQRIRPERRAWQLEPARQRALRVRQQLAIVASGDVKRHFHVLAVPDLIRSGAFYARILGFEVHEIGDAGWRLFVNGQCRIMAGECPDALPAEELGDHSYFGYLVVDDVQKYYERAVDGGAKLVKPLRDEPWGMREFGLTTIDGHRIMVGQAIDCLAG